MQNSMDSGLPLKNKWCSQPRKMCKKLVLLVATSEEKGTRVRKKLSFHCIYLLGLKFYCVHTLFKAINLKTET